jgi:hypothetical protein
MRNAYKILAGNLKAQTPLGSCRHIGDVSEIEQEDINWVRLIVDRDQ